MCSLAVLLGLSVSFLLQKKTTERMLLRCQKVAMRLKSEWEALVLSCERMCCGSPLLCAQVVTREGLGFTQHLQRWERSEKTWSKATGSARRGKLLAARERGRPRSVSVEGLCVCVPAAVSAGLPEAVGVFMTTATICFLLTIS